jgi:putative nucleotidyltransferase with HDIG domain
MSSDFESRKSNELLVLKLSLSMMRLNDPYTAYHQEETMNLAFYIGKKLGLDKYSLSCLSTAAGLHDIGKQGIPKEILSKPGTLREHEFELVKDHVALGVDILEEIECDEKIIRIVSEHHEKLDGSGYPKGLAGDQISLEGQILTVADITCALVSKRTYRPELSTQEIEDILLNEAPQRLNKDAVGAAIVYLDNEI